MRIYGDELSELQALEQALHRPDVRRSRSQVEALLDPDFVEFGASGAVYARSQTVESLAQETADADGQVTSSDYTLQRISDDAFLLTYEIQQEWRDGSRRVVLRSSIWKRRDGSWRMLFHQGTVKQSN